MLQHSVVEKDGPPHQLGGFGLSWDFIQRTTSPPLGVQLRAVVECLRALEEIHGDGSQPLWARVVGCLCRCNVMFRRDGSAFLVRAEQKPQPQPAAYLAPEARVGAAELRSDIYAVGVMLLETLAGRQLTGEDVENSSRAALDAHPVWSPHVGDPLLMVALRATAADRRRRFACAQDLADAVEGTADSRLASRRELTELIQQAIRSREDRDTPVAGVSSQLVLEPEPRETSNGTPSSSYVGAAPGAFEDEFEIVEVDEIEWVEEREPVGVIEQRAVGVGLAAPHTPAARVEDSLVTRRRRRRVPWGALLAVPGGFW